jgi:hypothetical protein
MIEFAWACDTRLILGWGSIEQEQLCAFMRLDSMGELLEHILQMPAFAAANRAMLRVIAEQWSAA